MSLSSTLLDSRDALKFEDAKTKKNRDKKLSNSTLKALEIKMESLDSKTTKLSKSIHRLSSSIDRLCKYYFILCRLKSCGCELSLIGLQQIRRANKLICPNRLSRKMNVKLPLKNNWQ